MGQDLTVRRATAASEWQPRVESYLPRYLPGYLKYSHYTSSHPKVADNLKTFGPAGFVV